jgi:hypothetical protein
MQPKLFLSATLLWLLACSAEQSDKHAGDRPPGSIQTAGSESGNPPDADHEVCLDESACKAAAEELANELSSPLSLPALESECVEDIGRGALCYCNPERHGFSFSGQGFILAPGDGDDADCVAWERIATFDPSLRSDPARCLYRVERAAACTASGCAEACKELDAVRRVDAEKSYPISLRFARCGDPDNGCVSVYELGGRCYARHGYGISSDGPFDCSLSNEQILDRAFPGWDEPVSCPPMSDC